jgi:hypothetical protein
MELQKRIDHLIDVEGYTSFALQDKNIKNKKVVRSNCVLYPSNAKGYKGNAENIRRELVHHIAQRPEQIYVLHYSRERITASSDYDIIDVPTKEIQTNESNTLSDMDDRNKEEKRSDELYIREILSKNGFLESEVERLKDKIEELEDKLEQEIAGNDHAQMADATTSTIGQVAQIVPMLFDKYFAIQERKNELLAEQIRRQAPPRPQPQNQTFEQPANGFYYEGEN